MHGLLLFLAVEGQEFAGTESAFGEVAAIFGEDVFVVIAVFFVVEFLKFIFGLGSALLGVDLERGIVLFVCTVEVGEADDGAVGVGKDSKAVSLCVLRGV